MAKFLVFDLYGPFQSWGQQAVNVTRPTDAYPTKSGVLGLVAAALGIPREQEAEHQRLQRSLGYGVCTLSTGHLARDYHTVQMPESRRKLTHHTRKSELSDPGNLKTILTQRDYRGDAFYVVALWQQNHDAPLEAIAHALKSPTFYLSLGRRSCVPCLPLGPTLREADTLAQAFKDHVAAYAEKKAAPLRPLLRQLQPWPKDEAHSFRTAWDSFPHHGMDQHLHIETRRDGPGSKTAWTFSNRSEHVGFLNLPSPYSKIKEA